MIISLLNQKGGVGKTTIAVNLADNLHLKKNRVLLIDSDPQGSSLDWANAREYNNGFPVVGLPKPSLHKDAVKFKKDYDYILIDAPPRSYDVARSILIASDLVLIPVQPSSYDVWATDEIIKLIEECYTFNENMKCAFVINRKITNTAIGRDIKNAFNEKNIPVLKTAICQRVLYAETAGQGSSVCRAYPNDIASQEIKNLTNDIMELLNEKTS